MESKRRSGLAVIAFVSLMMLASQLQAEPLAIVTDLVGHPKLAQSNELLVVNILDSLEHGQSVIVDKEFQITLVYLESGIEYKYVGPTSFVIGSLEPENVQGQLVEIRELKILEETGLDPTSDNLNQAAVVFRNVYTPGGAIELIGPSSTKILEYPLTFRWESLSDNARYMFTLNSNHGKHVFKITTDDNHLQLPSEIKLRNGRKYNWVVTSSLDGEAYRGTANFQMGSNKEISKILAIRPDANVSFSEKVIYALILEQHGFSYSADIIWHKLAAEKPNQPAIAARIEN